ncbi:heme ABC exporter ATP-binding protein CcmA [Methylocella sp.]|uniref:heme ABC exporter ATP-binding protein CcmA n=1 Tax=Methylocella sp. TaxID=1978226 RepID=UPI003782EC9C
MRLEAFRVSVERGGRRVLNDVSFALESGEMIVATGRNGAGKSTLLRALAGLLPLASGRVELAPAPDGGLGECAHYVGHADALKGALAARENLEFFAAMLDAGQGGARPLDALAAFGLAHVAEIPAAYLSAGQKRRVALARLLVARRPVWLLDEPTTALDVAAAAQLVAIIRAHLADGGLVVASTHTKLDVEARELPLGAAA